MSKERTDILKKTEFQGQTKVCSSFFFKKIQFMYDSNNEGAQDIMAAEINKYSR